MAQINLQNRSIYRNDNLQVLLRMPDKSVELIYLDPPFAKNQTFVGSNSRIAEIKRFFIDLQTKAQKDKTFEIHQGFSQVNLEDIFKTEEPAKFKDIWTENDGNAYYFKRLSLEHSAMMAYVSSIKSQPKGVCIIT